MDNPDDPAVQLMMVHRDNFIKFVADCSLYCLGEMGVRYEALDAPTFEQSYFNPNYGAAVLQYHGAHDEEYRTLVRKKPQSEVLTPEGLQEHLGNGIDMCFNGNLMEGILKFCSFYLDAAIFFYRYHKGNLINESLADVVGFVFDIQVRKLFELVHPVNVHFVWEEIEQMGVNLIVREKWGIQL